MDGGKQASRNARLEEKFVIEITLYVVNMIQVSLTLSFL